MGRKKVSFEGYDNWYTKLYTRTLRWSLGHRFITLVITFVIFIASIFMLSLVGTSFMDTGGENVISVEINMPYGNDQDLVDTAQKVEDQIKDLKDEQGKIRNYYTYLGSMTDPTESGIASLQIDLTTDSDMEQQADALRDKVEQNIGEIPNTTIKVIAAGMETQVVGGSGLEVRVIGREDGGLETLEDVKETTEELYEKIQALEVSGDIENLESELVTNQNDVSKQWTAAGLYQYATATGQTNLELVGQQLELEWYAMRFGWPITQLGHTSSTVIIGGNETGIAMPGIVKSLSDIDTVKDLRIGAASPMKLGDLADVEEGPTEYRRAEGGYAGTITAAITVDDVGAVNRDVQKIINDMKKDLPAGVSDIKIGGITEQMMEGFSDMSIAIGFAILIVFAILVISFRSWLTPLLIMVSMPLASIGAILALLITGKTLGMSGMMGILMLVGIVLTNAIVLLTFVDDRRKEGYNAHDALMDAGRIRLRPILMTALTTMIALVPLAIGFGEGALLASELGVVVIGGLFSSTLLTLVVVPVLYSLTERLRRRAPSNSG
jgi:HAE1 family hydrophobic/amphiphilic exporter-1